MLTSVLAWADVRDLALAHVNALQNEEAGSKRIIVSTGTVRLRMTPLQRLTVNLTVIHMARLGRATSSFQRPLALISHR